MATDPNAQPLSEAADSPVTNTGPQGPVSAAPLPLPEAAVESEAAPASSPKRPTRADWVRIAIFGIPYAVFFLVGAVPMFLFPESWNLTAINLAVDTVFLIIVLALFSREFFPAFSYLRTRPFVKVLLLFGDRRLDPIEGDAGRGPWSKRFSTATSSSASSAHTRPRGSSLQSPRHCLRTCILTSGRTSSHTCPSASS